MYPTERSKKDIGIAIRFISTDKVTRTTHPLKPDYLICYKNDVKYSIYSGFDQNRYETKIMTMKKRAMRN